MSDINLPMARILCLGNNTEDTDLRTRELAQQSNLPCHGLLSELESPLGYNQFRIPGYYHSSIYDIEFGRLLDICDQADLVIMLDQPKLQWSHPTAFYLTVKLMNETKSKTKFLDPEYKTHINFFSELVKNNSSFCIFPFIELVTNLDHTVVCCRSSKPVSNLDQLQNFATDPGYTAIRQQMLNGIPLPDHCSACYRLENMGIVSARQQETVEWANILDLHDLDDLKNITSPAYVEVRPSNKCNLLCRTCNPESSNLISKEYKKLNLISSTDRPAKNRHGFELVQFTNLKKLYVAGGEPTVMPEFYEFLDRCIRDHQTDFEILINTNGTNISQRFRDLLPHFSNLQFIFSIDGLDSLNHYIRWPSDWGKIMSNLVYLREHHHKVAINTTVSIYNISRLDQLFSYIEQKFPGMLIHVQPAQSPSHMSPWIYPFADRALTALNQVKNLQCYRNDSLLSSSINGYINFFEHDHTLNIELLTKFYEVNDQLDRNRRCRLSDHLPELDSYRKIVYNRS